MDSFAFYWNRFYWLYFIKTGFHGFICIKVDGYDVNTMIKVFMEFKHKVSLISH